MVKNTKIDQKKNQLVKLWAKSGVKKEEIEQLLSELEKTLKLDIEAIIAEKNYEAQKLSQDFDLVVNFSDDHIEKMTCELLDEYISDML